eukprot:g35610.t1
MINAQTKPAATPVPATSTPTPIPATSTPNIVVENTGNFNQGISADPIAQAIIKAQRMQQEQPESFPQGQPNQLVLQQLAGTQQYAVTPNNGYAMHNPALFQYHMLVGEQDLIRQQQAQRNNFMRLEAMWRLKGQLLNIKRLLA